MISCMGVTVIRRGQNPKNFAAVINERSPSGNTALHLAAGNGHLDTVMALVDYGGADVKAEGDWGYSALHFYAR